jgi:hypothetical protein
MRFGAKPQALSLNYPASLHKTSPPFFPSRWMQEVLLSPQYVMLEGESRLNDWNNNVITNYPAVVVHV